MPKIIAIALWRINRNARVYICTSKRTNVASAALMSDPGIEGLINSAVQLLCWRDARSFLSTRFLIKSPISCDYGRMRTREGVITDAQRKRCGYKAEDSVYYAHKCNLQTCRPCMYMYTSPCTSAGLRRAGVISDEIFRSTLKKQKKNRTDMNKCGVFSVRAMLPIRGARYRVSAFLHTNFRVTMW